MMKLFRRKLNLKVRYIDKGIEEMVKIEKGDLIDLRASSIKVNGEDKELKENGVVKYKAGDVVFVGLGFAMEMPKGYKANVYPRSSTFKNYGLILTNSVGQIDNTYCGNDDEWKVMLYALKDGEIAYNDRIVQMEVMKAMPSRVNILTVDNLGGSNRGGYGSTGKR